MPIAMAFSVIATANHFVIDVIVGVALVVAAFALEQASVVPRSVHVVIPGRRAHVKPGSFIHGHD